MNVSVGFGKDTQVWSSGTQTDRQADKQTVCFWYQVGALLLEKVSNTVWEAYTRRDGHIVVY